MSSFHANIEIGLTGEVCSYTHLAAKSFFQPFAGNNGKFHFQNTLKALFESLNECQIDYALTALESSSYGTIHAVYDLLLLSQGKLMIVGEIGQIEQHCLCVRADFTGSEAEIAKIFSHPHIMESCSDYLDAMDLQKARAGHPLLERCQTWNSAASCREVLTSSVPAACICSKEAAELNGLRILASSVGNYKNAETRYVIISRVNAEGIVHDPLQVRRASQQSKAAHSRVKSCRKASIAMALRNIPGSIFKMSSCFAFRNLDIVKIESRPATISYQLNLGKTHSSARGTAVAAASASENQNRSFFSQKHWDLIFYIDYEPSDFQEVQESLMMNLHEYCMWIVELGSYQNGLHSLDHSPSEWSTVKEVVSF